SCAATAVFFAFFFFHPQPVVAISGWQTLGKVFRLKGLSKGLGLSGGGATGRVLWLVADWVGCWYTPERQFPVQEAFGILPWSFPDPACRQHRTVSRSGHFLYRRGCAAGEDLAISVERLLLCARWQPHLPGSTRLSGFL